MKRIFWITIGIALVVLVAFKLYTNKKHINEQKEKGQVEDVIKIPVEVDTATIKNVVNTLEKTGTLIPDKKGIVYAETSGNIINLNFSLGSIVKKGEYLANINADKLIIDINNAKAKLSKIENDYNTYNELLQGGAATEEKVNQLKLELVNAQNTLKQLNKQLDDTKVKAPINGIIVEKNVESGVFVNVGTAIATVLNLDILKVKVFVNEQSVYNLKVGDTTIITTDVYPDKTFKGTISFISPEGDETHSYIVEVALTNNKDFPLKAGTFVYTKFTTSNNKNTLLIPKVALLENTNKAMVYTINNNKAVLHTLKVGNNYGEYVEVLEGLNKGDLVIISGQINLKDKSEVSITNTNKE
ncbi:efflux RND transporter periplasmic adaptor subunit [Neptunitalea lumnitzerae]|uniref:MexH family multidrug efflux RND transporter periplasmic adaptor subunit n=1 Tax=Neptunitalea lumnitzerae TaxID=2965509 RepID=A0ABQ5MJR9_9FLAO|nr:efflux RND transporter periplasmic adaptor subunit [Neptunitalea sp. Y10]GLB49582.1 MexH family multidrug efflux RND transporter periplasmic adaptor subunit [Neptunitalea sp. Y10]